MALPSTGEQYQEFRYMLHFARDNNCADNFILGQLRALWTAYCIHWELPVGNRAYTEALNSLEYMVTMDNPNFASQFGGFMGECL